MNITQQPTKKVDRVDPEELGRLIVYFVLAVLLWDTIFLYPIKLFVVILHEFSHGLAAVVTGGEIVKIEINPEIGGFCWTRGGNRAVTLSAGYVGSIVLGALIVLITSRTKYDNILGIVIGTLLIVLTLLFIRNMFGVLFTAGLGAALVVLCVYARNSVADFLLKFIGMASCLYAIIDIKDDLIDRTVDGTGMYAGIKSDAFALAEHLGFPQLSVAIGIFWMIVSLIVFFKVLGAAAKSGSEGS